MRNSAIKLLEKLKSISKEGSSTFEFKALKPYLGTEKRYWTLNGNPKEIIYLTEEPDNEPNTYLIDDFNALIKNGYVKNGIDTHLYILTDKEFVV